MSGAESYVCDFCRELVTLPFIHRCPKTGAVLCGPPKPLSPTFRPSGVPMQDQRGDYEYLISLTAPYADERTVIASVPPPPKPPEPVMLDNKKKDPDAEVKVEYLRSCARCGGEHRDLLFKKLTRPILGKSNAPLYTHWAPCPATGEPVLNRVVGVP